jgi:hypothetical protein
LLRGCRGERLLLDPNVPSFAKWWRQQLGISKRNARRHGCLGLAEHFFGSQDQIDQAVTDESDMHLLDLGRGVRQRTRSARVLAAGGWTNASGIKVNQNKVAGRIVDPLLKRFVKKTPSSTLAVQQRLRYWAR